jgi:hypothetical protein
LQRAALDPPVDRAARDLQRPGCLAERCPPTGVTVTITVTSTVYITVIITMIVTVTPATCTVMVTVRHHGTLVMRLLGRLDHG